MMRARLVIGLLLPRRMEGASDGEVVLTILRQELGEFFPESYGNSEPVRTPFTTLEECLKAWRPPFLWKRRIPFSADGAVWHGGDRMHTGIYLSTTSRRYGADHVLAFVKRAACELGADLAYAHVLTDAERDDPAIAYEMWYPIEIGITTLDLHQGLPNLCWCTVFGRPYLELIGRTKFEQLPAETVTDLDVDHVCVQMTCPLEESTRNYRNLQAEREMLKAALDPDLFRTRERSGKRHPRFQLGAA